MDTPTTLIQEHLLEQARRYASRAATPVTAWDCLAAQRWSDRCTELAGQVSGMTDEAALAHLKQIRAAIEAKSGSWSGWGFYAVFTELREMDTLIDPVARDLVGWITISTHGGLDDGKPSIRPGYRRMLGINHCVSACGRERGESDEDWLNRRNVWLAKYHPDIKVIRDHNAWSDDRTQYTHIVGSVREIMTLRHLVERDLVEGMQFLKSNRHAHSMRVVDAGPLNRDDGVEFLARATPEPDEEPLPVGTKVATAYGQGLIVA